MCSLTTSREKVKILLRIKLLKSLRRMSYIFLADDSPWSSITREEWPQSWLSDAWLSSRKNNFPCWPRNAKTLFPCAKKKESRSSSFSPRCVGCHLRGEGGVHQDAIVHKPSQNTYQDLTTKSAGARESWGHFFQAGIFCFWDDEPSSSSSSLQRENGRDGKF